MKNELIRVISTINLQYQHKQIENLYPELYKWIVDSTKQYTPSSIIESIYIILNGPPSLQCQYSTTSIKKFINFNKGYSKFCSDSCQCIKDFKQRKLGKLSNEQNNIRLNKRSNTNLKRYGVEYPAQSSIFKEKAKQTCLEKYGVENASALPEIREKAKQTHIERYGVVTLISTDAVQEKIKQTNLEKFGVEYPLQSAEIRDKSNQTNLERYGVENPQQLIEIREKSKQTCLEKYGTEYPQKLDEIKNKIKKTTQERYRVEYPAQSSIFKEKSKQTSLEHYGVENPSQSDKIKEKIKQLNLKKYGVEYPTQLDDFKEKIKTTNIDRYGVEYSIMSKNVQEKIKQTNFENFGVEYLLQSNEIREKAKQTNLERYGTKYPSQVNEIKNKIKKTNLEKYGVENFSQTRISKSSLNILKDKQSFIDVITDKTIKEVCSILSISTTTVLVYSKKYDVYNLLNTSSSSYELLIEKLLNELNIQYIRNNRTIIKPLELDFYIPNYKLAIEVGSLYFHNEITGNKNKFYHYNKWKQCKDQNITLLQYFDNDLLNNWRIIESKIKRICNIQSPIVGSRKLELRELNDYNAEKMFMDTYHLQGTTSKRNIIIGAYYNNELVAISTWLIKDNITELVRYATNINYSYPGLFSRMLSKFKLLTNFRGTLISFSDNRHSNGNLYKTSGFNLEYITKPGYMYSINSFILESRLKYQKHKLKKIFNLTDDYINSHTEWQIMQEMGYDRLWDAGQSKWSMTI